MRKVKTVPWQKEIHWLVEEPALAATLLFMVYVIIAFIALIIFGQAKFAQYVPWQIPVLACVSVVFFGVYLAFYRNLKLVQKGKGFVIMRINEDNVVAVSQNWIHKGKLGQDRLLEVVGSGLCRSTDDYVVQTELIYRQANVNISLTVTITITLNDDFSPYDLYHKLMDVAKVSDDSRWVADLDDYVINQFLMAIKDNREEINALLDRITNPEAQWPSLMNEMVGLMSFPDRLFQNFAEWRINIGQPSISACKGSCTS